MDTRKLEGRRQLIIDQVVSLDLWSETLKQVFEIEDEEMKKTIDSTFTENKFKNMVF